MGDQLSAHTSGGPAGRCRSPLAPLAPQIPPGPPWDALLQSAHTGWRGTVGPVSAAETARPPRTPGPSTPRIAPAACPVATSSCATQQGTRGARVPVWSGGDCGASTWSARAGPGRRSQADARAATAPTAGTRWRPEHGGGVHAVPVSSSDFPTREVWSGLGSGSGRSGRPGGRPLPCAHTG